MVNVHIDNIQGAESDFSMYDLKKKKDIKNLGD